MGAQKFSNLLTSASILEKLGKLFSSLVLLGEVGFPKPAVLGHEISGTVVGLGPGADAFLLDKRVMSPFIMPCGTSGVALPWMQDVPLSVKN